jgi:RecB family exonuclease
MKFEFRYSKEPLGHISISQARTFKKCQVQWYFDKLTDYPSKPQDRVLLGNVVHAGLAQANKLRMVNTAIAKPLVLETAIKELFELNERYSYEFLDWGDVNGVATQAEKVLDRVTTQLDEITGQPMLVEHPIGDPKVGGQAITFEGGLSLVGYVDLVDVNGSVYDFKVGKKKSQQDADQDVQLAIYAYAIHGLPDEPVKVALVSVDSKTGSPTTQESSRDKFQCEQAFEDMNTTAKSISMAVKDHHFMPSTEGWHCSPAYCGYFGVCPFKGGKI